MRLKKIRLAGFKSFVDPTNIPFPGDMTAIVGPNGCGKSNVIDAVRWVLGESSAKNLRGDAMTDVIFNGSSARKPVGQCSVELVFDNSAGRITGEYAAFNELSVKRLVTREAQSSYFLNGTRCRRKDVTDLFLGTGLGPRSYAIIEQGMISRLIESKPQELRVFLEEAAGVSRYKERRRETENRISHTKDNLERLDDVRAELGRQLDKLSRQAAAAQRYKTLKAEERSYRAQLAAMRWMAHNEKMEAVRAQQQHEQRELDALQVQLRSGEAGLTSKLEKAAELKAVLDDNQHKKFTLTTSITRIEQDRLHHQQRTTQLTRELAELNEQHTSLQAEMAQTEAALTEAQGALQRYSPELALLDARLEQSEDNQQHSEARLRDYQQQVRDTEQRYQHVKQQVAQFHSKIEATAGMQQRTHQRIGQLQEALSGCDKVVLQAQLDEVDSQCAQLSRDVVHLEERVDATQQALAIAQQEQHEAAHRLDLSKGELQDSRASLAALNTLAQTRAAAEPAGEQFSPAWQHIAIAPQWAKAAQAVLAYFHDPIIANTPQGHAFDNLALPDGTLLWLDSQLSDQPVPDSLAAYLLPHSAIPAVFNQIKPVSTLAQAISEISELTDEQLLVTAQGQLLTAGWIYQYGDDTGQGALEVAMQIERLTGEVARLDGEVAQARQTWQNTDAARQDADEAVKASASALQHAQLALTNQQHKSSMLNEEIRRQNSRSEQLTDELKQQTVLLQEETEEIDLLSEQLSVASEQLAQYGEQREHCQATKEQLEGQLAHHRQAVVQCQQERHQLQLTVQQYENNVARQQDNLQRFEQRYQEQEARQQRLQHEYNSLSAPLAQQQQTLQQLLADKEALDNQMQISRSELQALETFIDDARKTQQDISSRLASRQTGIDGLTIEIESIRARADAVLEQLSEAGQALKEVLEKLPADAHETQWQSQLEQTAAALGKLGAVNLAAVEEYEIQAERKQHLDTQFDDLTLALETLQSAIRKIDKETRTRFSATFDQVNSDLQALFPKVFGGGSAYLDLTGDDMLETGVTIMARPPGKKNSTIHLLSGGEKALTALSLVFAIFRLNPAPFCLLDEVDAPLDDANVGRFCNLVSQMSSSVQFIYITHNKIAMEMATHLTGVTMAEPGVSRMVAVDVDEAMAFVEA